MPAASGALRTRGIPGGRHPGGTGNWLIPLEPPQYLELVYVADRDAVAASPAAELLTLDLSAQPLLGWALRTDDIEAVGRRLSLEPVTGWVHDPDGRESRWRTVADLSMGATSRPFFIEYDDPEKLRPQQWQKRYALASHDVPIGGFSWIELGGDETSTREWIDDQTLPIRWAPGAPGLRAVAVARPGGDLVLGSGPG